MLSIMYRYLHSQNIHITSLCEAFTPLGMAKRMIQFELNGEFLVCGKKNRNKVMKNCNQMNLHMC